MTNLGILVAIIGLFLLFFRFHGRFLLWISESVTGFLIALLLHLLLTVVTGWVVYILIAMIGMLPRIRSVEDVLTILQARPSQIGGSGMIGVVFGLIFAMYTMLHWRPATSSGVIQGQTVRFEGGRGGGVVQWLRRKIQRRLK